MTAQTAITLLGLAGLILSAIFLHKLFGESFADPGCAEAKCVGLSGAAGVNFMQAAGRAGPVIQLRRAYFAGSESKMAVSGESLTSATHPENASCASLATGYLNGGVGIVRAVGPVAFCVSRTAPFKQPPVAGCNADSDQTFPASGGVASGGVESVQPQRDAVNCNAMQRSGDMQPEKDAGGFDRADYRIEQAAGVAPGPLANLLRTVCSQCDAHMRGPTSGPVTHSICPECQDEFRRQREALFAKQLTRAIA